MPDIFIGGDPIPTAAKKADPAPAAGKTAAPDKKIKLPGSHMHIFESYCDKPTHVEFIDKLEDEELLLFLRKHFITNVPWILRAVGLALIPIIISVVMSAGLLNITFLPSNYILMIFIFYYFVVFGYTFANYLTWFYNISLVTSQRIIDIDFSQIVFENVAATKLSQVEDVSYSQIGVLRSVFDYGNVLVQTAAREDEFEFMAVPHPEKVIKIINNLIGNSNNA